MELNKFLSYLDGVENVNPKQKKALCPCHSDTKPSLYITWNDTGIGLCCRSPRCGARAEDVVKKLGLSLSDLYFEKTTARKHGKLQAVYDYINPVTGQYLYSRLRYRKANGEKEFSQGIRQADGHIDPNKPKDLHGIYIPPTQSLEELRYSKIVCITEGEKDCITVSKQGLIAFTYGSADKNVNDWQPEFADICKGKDTIIFVDNDEPGIEIADQIEKDLTGKAKSVLKILPMPIMKGGDITDYIAKEKGDIFQLIGEHRQGKISQEQDIIDLMNDERFLSLTYKQRLFFITIYYQATSRKDVTYQPTDGTKTYINWGLYKKGGKLNLYGSKETFYNDRRALEGIGAIKKIESNTGECDVFRVVRFWNR